MTMSKINFIDNPAAAHGFEEIIIDCAKALQSWQKSVYSYEWLTPDGAIKARDALSPSEQAKREATEKHLHLGTPIPKPILGIGIMDNIEIGTGRADFLTLIDQGHTTLPVHIPTGQAADFKAFIAQNTADKAEAGSIIFYILGAVVLLAALSFTVSKSTQSTVSGVSEEQARLIGTEIIATTSAIAESVAKLRLNGCLQTQISFEAPTLTDHINGSAPGDESCHIYALNGGELSYQPINAQAATAGASLAWQFTGDLEVENVGTSCAGDDCADLLALARNINRQTCEQLNDLSSINNTIPTIALNAPSNFEGSFDYTDTLGDDTTHAALSGKRSGCFQDTTNSSYIFYRVLMSR